MKILVIILTSIIVSLSVTIPASAQIIEGYIAIPSPSVNPDFIILNPSDDSFLLQDQLDPENLKGSKNLVFGDQIRLKLIDNHDENPNEKLIGTPIIKFDLTDVSSEEIDYAYLLLYVTGSSLLVDSVDVRLHLAENNWSEKTVNSLSPLKFSIQPINTISIENLLGQWVHYDVTDLIKQNSGSEISFVLTFANYDPVPKVLEFASKELDPNFSPKIMIKKVQDIAYNNTSSQISEPISEQLPKNSTESIVLLPMDDSYVGYDVADPQDLHNLKSLNFGDKEFLKLWYSFNSSNSTENQILTNAYIKFDLSDVPPQDITSAKLRMFATDVDLAFDDIGVSIHAAESDWSELSLNGTNLPEFTVEPIDIAMVTEPNQWYEWDVTSHVKSSADSPMSLFMIFSEITNGTNENVSFASKENTNSDIRPSLVINPVSADNESDIQLETDYLIIVLSAIIGIGILIYIKKKKNKKISL